MLSFLLSIGARARSATRPHTKEVLAALAARSWSDSGAEAVQDGHPAQGLYHCGAHTQIRYGSHWHLLCSSLSRGPQSRAQQRLLDALHHALQEASLDAARAQMRRALQQREAPEVWVAWSPTHACAIAFRDPLGRVPLYIYAQADGFLLSNTRRALEPWVQHEPIASPQVLAALLSMGIAPTSQAGFFRNLSRVAPGTCAVLRPETPILRHRWWHWQQPTLQEIHLDDAAAHYRALLRASLQKTLHAPLLGVELSGGMDSTTVLAAAREVRPEAPIHAINYAINEEDEDRVLARDLAARWNATFYGINPGAPVSIPTIEPAVPPTALHTLHTLRALDQPIDVLSGHGGDNLFRVQRPNIERMRHDLSPIQWLQHARAHQKIHGQLPPLFLRERMGRGGQESPLTEYLLPWFDREISKQIQRFIQDRIDESTATSTIESLTYHPRWSSILEMGDAGFHGERLQFHFPFFDLDLMRFVASIPAIPWRYNKYLARYAYRGVLPASITERSKTVHRPTRHKNDIDFKSLEHANSVPWIRGDKLTQWAQHPERFPGWTYASAQSLLELLTWSRAQPTSRLTIAPKPTT